MTRIRGRNGSAVQALGAQPGRCVADEMLLRMWEHLVHGEPKGRISLKLVFTLRSEDLWTCSSLRSSVLSSLSPPFLPVCMGTCLLFHIPVSPHLPQYGTSFFFFFSSLPHFSPLQIPGSSQMQLSPGSLTYTCHWLRGVLSEITCS